jgi:hypothetical protein
MDNHIVIYHWFDKTTNTWRPDYEEPGYDKSKPFGPGPPSIPIDYWNDKPPLAYREWIDQMNERIENEFKTGIRR